MRWGRWQNIQRTEHLHLLWEWFQFTARKILIRSDYIHVHYPALVNQLLTDISVKYRSTIGEVSAKCRWTKSYIGRDTSGTTIDRVSTDYRPLYRPTVDRVSTEYRPSVDRVSTDCRPSVDRLSTVCRLTIDRVSTAISTDISVDITHSKQDPIFTHISFNRWDKYRKRKVPCTVAVRFTQLLSFENSLF